MAFNRDIGTAPENSLQEAFNNGMIATRERYRGMLFMYQDRLEAIRTRHDEEREVYRLLCKLELVKELFNMAAMRKEKKKLETQLVLAREKMDGVKIPYVDWIRLVQFVFITFHSYKDYQAKRVLSCTNFESLYLNSTFTYFCKFDGYGTNMHPSSNSIGSIVNKQDISGSTSVSLRKRKILGSPPSVNSKKRQKKGNMKTF
ncbi:hypothetical protein Bca4012_065132 [Brassica carinata]